MDATQLAEYQVLLRDESNLDRKDAEQSFGCEVDSLEPDYGLDTKEALIRLNEDIEQEISLMKNEFSKRSFICWLRGSISFESELSKMRWPSVFFMIAQAMVHFVVAFLIEVNDLTANWIGVQGFILTGLLLFNIAINLWDTKLRFKELLMKAEKISNLVKQCSQDKRLLRQWIRHNWMSATAKRLFIPKSPCIHNTLTYRDRSCVNMSDFLLVRGDIIHLLPGDRAPGDCISVKLPSSSTTASRSKLTLRDGQMFHLPDAKPGDGQNELDHEEAGEPANTPALNSKARERFMLPSHAKLRKALVGADFLMTSTPYINSLRISLQRSHKRPVNSVEKECFIVSRKYFETYVIPAVFVLSTIVTAIHYAYLDLTDSDQKIKISSIAQLLLRPSLTIMPFLPWMFPCFWIVVNAYGSARLLCCAESQRVSHKPSPTHPATHDQSNFDGTNGNNYSPSWFQRDSAHRMMGVNLLATPTAAGSSENKHGEEDLHQFKGRVKLRDVIRVFWDLVFAKSGHIWRSSSLLQVLGCLTSLCCIDKVGILSWPNPTPEKVFILAQPENKEDDHRVNYFGLSDNVDHFANHGLQTTGSEGATNLSVGSMGNPSNNATTNSDLSLDRNPVCGGSSNSPPSTPIQVDHHLNPLGGSKLASPVRESGEQDQFRVAPNLRKSSERIHLSGQNATNNHTSQCRPEILDISHSSDDYRQSHQQHMNSPGRPQFDDLNWRKHLSNLKPLGLTILMNNCCESSFASYFRFYKHISYKSVLACNLTPVVKRRCICALSRLIGFTDDQSYTKSYQYIDQIGLYKLVDPISLNKDNQLVSSIGNNTRLKLPFSNMICNIHQDKSTGSHQVFSQGTADLVLDACAEFWDGKQLVQLDEAIRKRVKDFYHRTSLTGYCFAFSYAPILRPLSSGERFIELPSESARLISELKMLSNEREMEHLRTHQLTIRPTQETLIDPSDRNMRFDPSDSSMWTTLQSDGHDNEEEEEEDFDDCRGYNKSLETRDKLPSFKLIGVSSTGVAPRRHLSTDSIVGLTTSPKKHQQSKSKEPHQKGSNNQLTEALDELTEQVFVGMVSMQYQACPDFVGLVEQLEQACIRFVHFSKENELRSRVFSEKMGLESGWNCHISLQSDQDLDRAKRCEAPSPDRRRSSPVNCDILDPSRMLELQRSKLQGMTPSARVSSLLRCETGSSNNIDYETNNSSMASSWKSLPSLVMRLACKLAETATGGLTEQLVPDLADPTGSEMGDHKGGNPADEEEAEEQDHLESLAFDMSNRAKLPKGIENIRPHLEQVDNVPLQVSLFTDCTPELTREMVEIMQDWGEIVCVIGSSSSRLNTATFLQANATIAIEPLDAESCVSDLSRPAELGQRANHGASSIGRHRQHRARSRSRTGGRVRSRHHHHRSLGEPKEPISMAIPVASPPTPRLNPRDRLGISSGVVVIGGGGGGGSPALGGETRVRRYRDSSSSSGSSSSLSSLSGSNSLSSRSRSLSPLSAGVPPSSRSMSASSSSSSSSSSLSFTASSSPPPTVDSSRSPSRRRTRRPTPSDSLSDGGLDDSDDNKNTTREDQHRHQHQQHPRSRHRNQINIDKRNRVTRPLGPLSTKQDVVQKRDRIRRNRDRSKSTNSNSNNNNDDEDYQQHPEDQQNAIPNEEEQEEGYDDDYQKHPEGHLARALPVPGALASKLASLPCSFAFHRRDPVNLYALIMEARHYTFKMKNTFICMICFALSISSAQFLASILFLPPMLSSGLTIWLTIVVVPLMSFSLMNTPMEPQVMKMAVGKNLQLKPENITFFVICYLVKFIPSIIVVVLSFGLIIAHSCQLTGFGASSLGPCWMFTYVRHSNHSGGQPRPPEDDQAEAEADRLWSAHLLTAQVCAAFLMVLYLVVISSGFVHRSKLVWQKSPTSNRMWVAISLGLISCQVLVNQLVLRLNLGDSQSSEAHAFISSLPVHIWTISFIWPIIVISLNLLVKRAEIKATTRQQRRARFDFNTKLGMNSPF